MLGPTWVQIYQKRIQFGARIGQKSIKRWHAIRGQVLIVYILIIFYRSCGSQNGDVCMISYPRFEQQQPGKIIKNNLKTTCFW